MFFSFNLWLEKANKRIQNEDKTVKGFNTVCALCFTYRLGIGKTYKDNIDKDFITIKEVIQICEGDRPVSIIRNKSDNNF
jgi:hypothetical protein